MHTCFPLCCVLLHVCVVQEAVRMDHLEVVKLMEQSGGKVWEEGRVSHRHTAVAEAEAVTAQPGSHGMNSSRTSSSSN